jgi:hypothetical protein
MAATKRLTLKETPMRALIAAALASFALVTPAFASGGLWCNVDDANWKFDVESGMTRGMGSPFFNFRASAVIKDKRVLQEFRSLDLAGKLVHSWVNGETKLSFYTEIDKNDAIYSLEIVIDTKPVDEESDGEYAGTYQIVTYDPTAKDADSRLELTGPITCGSE